MKNHLKRIASPRTWKIDRKSEVFILRPNAGGHSLAMGLPLGLLLRDFLQFSSTMREAKKILNGKQVLVDGKRRKDHRFMVGLFDVIEFPEMKKSYRIVLDRKGITFREIDSAEKNQKVCKVMGKSVVKGAKIQLNLHDGKNILTDQKVKVGDTVVIKLPQLEIEKVLPFEQGATVFLTKGKHSGDLGKLKEIKDKEAIYESGGKEIETTKDYLFIVGGKEGAVIQLQDK